MLIMKGRKLRRELGDLKNWDERLVRKGLVSCVFVGDPATAVVNDIFDTNGHLLALPAGYFDSGYVSTVGIGFGRDVSVEDTTRRSRSAPTAPNRGSRLRNGQQEAGDGS
ncbi:hypothetical protein, partial [Fodinicola feengrottensis]